MTTRSLSCLARTLVKLEMNKYDFPPPIDTNLFYGKLCLVKATIDDSDDNLRLFLGDLTRANGEDICCYCLVASTTMKRGL